MRRLRTTYDRLAGGYRAGEEVPIQRLDQGALRPPVKYPVVGAPPRVRATEELVIDAAEIPVVVITCEAMPQVPMHLTPIPIAARLDRSCNLIKSLDHHREADGRVEVTLRYVMKIRLSMPRMISSTTRVSRPPQMVGSVSHSIM